MIRINRKFTGERHGKLVDVSCSWCGKSVVRHESDLIGENIFCSRNCYLAYRKRNRIDITCEYCGKQDRVIPSRIQGNHYLCSDKCARKFFVSPRTKVLCQNCGEEFEYVKEWYKAERKFCSQRCFGEYRQKHGLVKGENSPFWKGGISFEEYSAEFNDELKTEVRQRDKYTCQECGYTETQLGYTLNCHHIDYNKENCELSNLISLCSACHAQTNFRREDWIAYFQDKLASIEWKPVQLVFDFME